MTKMRVYEMARELGWDSKQVLDALTEAGVDVKNHMSVVEDAAAVLGSLKQTGPAAQSEAAPAADVPESEATRPAKKPVATSTVQKPAATSTVQKPKATSTVQKPKATSTVQKPKATSTVQKPAAAKPSGDAARARTAGGATREVVRKGGRPAAGARPAAADRPAAELPLELRQRLAQQRREAAQRAASGRGQQVLVGGAGVRPARPPVTTAGGSMIFEPDDLPDTPAAPVTDADEAQAAAPADEPVERTQPAAEEMKPAPATPATAAASPAVTADEEAVKPEDSADPAPARPAGPVSLPRLSSEPRPAAEARTGHDRPRVSQPVPRGPAKPRPPATGPLSSGLSRPIPASERRRQDPGDRRPFERAPRPGMGDGPARGGGPRPGGPGRGGRGRGGRLHIPPPPPQIVAQQPQGGGGRGRSDRRRSDDDMPWREGDARVLEKRGRRGPARRQTTPTPPIIRTVTLEGPLTVKDLSQKMAVAASEIIKQLMALGVLATINQEIDVETAEIVATELGFPVELKLEMTEAEMDAIDEEDDPADLKPRPPVVTVMGHVDHGKTSLLDAIRQARVAAGEAGGITQHIGAYQVSINDRLITFLDTPGHEAFTAMRARGANITDVAVLVVAADDGVMPQTIESINHAKAADVPIVVAINKIDKDTANPDRVMTELSEHGLVPEEWGGDTVMVPVSAKERQNIDQLLEMILLVTDVRELKANPDRLARGTVIEAQKDSARGAVATLLVQNGTLKVGDSVVAGGVFGRVRALISDTGKRVKEAGPSTPVEVLGFGDVPIAGDVFRVFADEREARQMAEKRAAMRKTADLAASSRLTLEDLQQRIAEGQLQDLNLIVKADVQGSVEALRESLEKLRNEEVRVNVIHAGVGAITESDVMLAATGNGAIIIGFHVRPDANARAAAEREKVDIRLYRVIYEAIEDIEAAMQGMLKPTLQETILGRAEVREVFRVPRAGTVAGSYVLDGKIVRGAQARLLRDNVVIYEGRIESLRRFKDDVREVQTGFECGIGLENFNDIKHGDQIEAFELEEVQAGQA